MPVLNLTLASAQETQNLGALLAQFKSELPSVWLLQGDLGSGKTTFSQGLAKGLGIKEHLTSPTFSLVNEYHFANGQTLFHFDLYRLGSLEELYEIGIEDYLRDPQAFSLIEWPEHFLEAFPPPYLHLFFHHAEQGRQAEIHLPEAYAMLEIPLRKALKTLHVTIF